MEFKCLVYRFYSFDANYISFKSETVFQNYIIFEVIKTNEQTNKLYHFYALLFPDFLLPNLSSYTVFSISF